MIVSLTPQSEEIVRKRMESGRYHSPADVVGDALRLLEEYESARNDALANLRSDVEAGWKDVEAGRVRDFNPEETKRRARERLKRATSGDDGPQDS